MKAVEQRFGERVRKLRLARNLSQEELAFRAGVHRTYLGGIERGGRNPSLRNITAIGQALNVSLAQLFSFDDLELEGNSNIDKRGNPRQR